MIVLIWLLLFSIWFWLLKDEFQKLIMETGTANVKLGPGLKPQVALGEDPSAIYNHGFISPKVAEYIVGVLGIILFFFVGYLFVI